MATFVVGGGLAYGIWYAARRCDPEDGRALALVIAGFLLFSWFNHVIQLDDLEERSGMRRMQLLPVDDYDGY